MSVDDYIKQHKKWEGSLSILRQWMVDAGLKECIKWNAPVYTLDNKNLIGLGAFKQHIGLWFFQGALLNDPDKKLLNAQEGKTKAMRQWRFESADNMLAEEATIKRYIQETISNHKKGLVIHSAKPKAKAFAIPSELEAAFSKNAALQEAFLNLTPYKQKEFAEHIGGAKRESTRANRLKKSIPMILNGVGLHDKYRQC